MDETLRSPGGGIRVKTTERGLPTALDLAESELARQPMDLANEILALCRLSGMRLQVARRNALIRAGAGTGVIRTLNLATPEEMQRFRSESFGADEPDDEAETWLEQR